MGYLYDENEFDADDDDDVSDWTFDGEITKIWTFRRGNIRTSGQTGYETQYAETEYEGITNYYRAEITAEYQLLRRLVGNTLAAYSWEKNLFDDIEDKTTRAEAGLTYSTTEKLDLNILYRYQYRDSDVIADDARTNSIQVGAAYTPNRYMQFDTNVSYQDYDSRVDTDSYTETRYYIGATFFPYTYRRR